MCKHWLCPPPPNSSHPEIQAHLKTEIRAHRSRFCKASACHDAPLLVCVCACASWLLDFVLSSILPSSPLCHVACLLSCPFCCCLPSPARLVSLSLSPARGHDHDSRYSISTQAENAREGGGGGAGRGRWRGPLDREGKSGAAGTLCCCGWCCAVFIALTATIIIISLSSSSSDVHW